jgi:nitrogenase molybdenum-iron protein NifN
MATIIKRTKAMTVNPLKNSQPVGATLAFLGLSRAMPLMHGSQGCTAFAKVQFVRHFREPIPLQTTAMDQVSTVMGGDASIVEALATIFSKNKPQIIGLMTTGLTETQGTDIQRAVKEFRAVHPEFADRYVVPVNTPDFSGSLESGHAAAVRAMVETLVRTTAEAGTQPGRRARQVNILPSASLTPGDVEALKDICEAFDLRSVVLPDISDSLDGHLIDQDFVPHTLGGTPMSDIALMGDSAATLVIGPSLYKAADLLAEKTGVPVHRFDHLYGLEAFDLFVLALTHIAGRPVPAKIERQRAQLQDAMVDCHFMLGQARVAIAGEPDHLLAITALLQGLGAEIVAAVAPAKGPALEKLPIAEVKIGDLEDLERAAGANDSELLIGNSHCAQGADRLGVPLLRLGIPQYDTVGGYQRECIGYRGARQLLFDVANLRIGHNTHEIAPYRSIYGQKLEYRTEGYDDGIAKAVARA